MSNKEKKLIKLVKKVAESSLKKDANQTTCAMIYQPAVPEAIKQFKKKI